jgi:hypothetical protein
MCGLQALKTESPSNTIELILLEGSSVAQLFKKFRAFCGTRRIITANKSASH